MLVADISSVKIVEAKIFGLSVIVPLGTIAFGLTFLATDVISEVYGRSYSFYVLVAGMIMRSIAGFYFFLSIGDASGAVLGYSTPDFWSTESQNSFHFVLGSSIPIFVAGVVAVLVASANDIFVFHFLKRRHENKNLFWVRNNISTILSQIVNSILFITIAYASAMPVKALVLAIMGQSLTKFLVAILDTPIAYLMRNYALNSPYWYKFWMKEFWKG